MLTNRINRLTVRNYRSLADVTVDFEDLTVLVGPNGSGKSNILDVLRFVRDALTLGLDKAMQDRGGIMSLRRFSLDGELYDISIEIELTADNHSAAYNIVIGGDEQGQYFVKNHNLEGENFLKHMGFYSIFPDNLRLPQPVKYKYPLSERGDNLATVLRDFISDPQNGWRDDLYQSLSTLIPHITAENPLTIQALGSFLLVTIKHTDGTVLDLSQESEGTLRILSLLTALYQQPPLPLVGIEEPELSVYPREIEALRDILYQASHQSQIIFTTHSPDLISCFNAHSLRVVERVNGLTRVGHMREDQRKVIEKELFSGGDLLRLEGLKID